MGKLSRGKTEKYTYYQQQLQSRCEQQRELLLRLQRDHAIVTDPAVKFEREQQIEKVRSELEQEKLDLNLLETALTTGDDSTIPPQYKRKPKPESIDRKNLLTLLQGVKNSWIEGVFKHSLHNEVLIELRKTQEEDAVDRLEHPLNLSLDTPDDSEEDVLLEDDIQEIYEDAGGTLLILGAPGAGKTISLLDLTRRLANDAVFDSDQPIPVVFNLSSYSDKRQPLADWLVDELLATYRIPTKIGRKWVEDAEHQPLILMLDGLDEVAEELRPACVQALNAYRDEYALSGIVVACRDKEYREIADKLKLEQALCVQSLTEEQIEKYLFNGGEELAGLRTALREDAALQELARSPLMLSMMCLAYKGKDSEVIFQDVGEDTGKRQHNLFATYVRRMFQRPRSGVDYEEEKTRRWLTFLAYNMQKHGQTIFQMENLQPSWLLKKKEHQIGEMLITFWDSLLLLLSMPVVFFLTLSPFGDYIFGDLSIARNNRMAVILLFFIPFTNVLILHFVRRRNIHTIEYIQFRWMKFGLIFICGIMLGGLTFIYLDHPHLTIYHHRLNQQLIILKKYGFVREPRFSPDSNSIVIRDGNRSELWTRDGKKIWEFEQKIRTLRFSLDSTVFVTRDAKNKLILWTRMGKKIREFRKKIHYVKFSPDGTALYTRDANGKIMLWTLDGIPIKKFGNDLEAVLFSPDGTLFVVIDSNNNGRLWVKGQQKVKALGGIRHVEFSPEGSLFLATNYNYTSTLWTRKGEKIKKFPRGRKNFFRVLDFVQYDRTLFFFSYDADGRQTLWNWNGKAIKKVGSPRIRLLWFTPDGASFFIEATPASSGGPLWASLDGKTYQKVINRINLQRASPDMTSFTSLGAPLYSGRSMTLWILDGKKINKIARKIRNVKWSQDSTLIAVEESDYKWKIWTNKGKEVEVFGNSFKEVEFSPGNGFIVTQDAHSKETTLWTKGGQKVKNFGFHMKNVKFSPDDHSVLLVSGYNFWSLLAFTWVLVGFVAGLRLSLRTNTVKQTQNKPNVGIWRTLKNSLLMGVIIGSFVALTSVMMERQFRLLSIHVLFGYSTFGLLNAFAIGMLYGLLIGMWFYGLRDFLYHFTLRFILWLYGYAPWNYARFLDHATDRIFLRKVGGGYIFVHRLLLEYFAAEQSHMKLPAKPAQQQE